MCTRTRRSVCRDHAVTVPGFWLVGQEDQQVLKSCGPSSKPKGVLRRFPGIQHEEGIVEEKAMSDSEEIVWLNTKKSVTLSARQ